jgi:hypothetical protein
MSVPATGKRHRRRVEAVVHEALGDVLDLDARGLLERPAVDDELVRHPARLPRVEHLEVPSSRFAM